MTFDMRDSTSYEDPGLKMWDTFALATVLNLKLDPERAPLLKAPHSQSNLKSPQTLATANFVTHFIISIAVLENVTSTQGYRKEPPFPH
jgi:hypothetical protein